MSKNQLNIEISFTGDGPLYRLNDNEGGSFIDYLKKRDNPDEYRFYNLFLDLINNGIARQKDDGYIIPNDAIFEFDTYESNTLKLPPHYKEDIFVSYKGVGFKDVNGVYEYQFQKNSNELGIGIPLSLSRKGAIVTNEKEYWQINNKQFSLLETIDTLNKNKFISSHDAMCGFANVQKKANEAKAFLQSKINDLQVILPKKFSVDIEKVEDDKYRLVPDFEDVDNEKLKPLFLRSSRIKSDYNYTKDDKKVRLIVDTKENEDDQSVVSQLKKVKEYKEVDGNTITELYDNISSSFDPDIIDLDKMGARVKALGLYVPKVHVFSSGEGNNWLPGISINDEDNGVHRLVFNSMDEVIEFEKIIQDAETRKEYLIDFQGFSVRTADARACLGIVKRQFIETEHPVAQEVVARKVLVIKDNEEDLEMGNGDIETIPDKFILQRVDSLNPSIELKSHQIDGVAWMQSFYNSNKGGGLLLADDMGLGKTLQVLYFLEWVSSTQNSMRPHLIVAPVSLIENWGEEFNKFFPKSSLKFERILSSDVRSWTNNESFQLNRNTIYITNYETVRRYQFQFASVQWEVVVLDEAQKIKTPGIMQTNAIKALNACFRIAMTGTPVENSLLDLWCIMDFASPGVLQTARSFKQKYQSSSLDQSDVEKERRAQCLRDEIGLLLLRRMKKDVAKDLPSLKNEVVKVEMTSAQWDLYKMILNLEDKCETNIGILQRIQKLRSISDHPYIEDWSKYRKDELVSSSAKLQSTIDLLENIRLKQEKAIIFTDNKKLQSLIQDVLCDKYNCYIPIINGDTPTQQKSGSGTKSRQSIIHEYSKPDGFAVIIMSPIAAGYGLNVVAANHVIHYTRHWNPAKEQQATDRAYRIGQNKDVHVYYPMAVAPDNQIETFDVILDHMLKRKMNLATSTLFPSEKIEVHQNEIFEALSKQIID